MLYTDQILKNHVDVLKQPLSYLIKLSFRQGFFPESLKSARVTAVYKKDDPKIFCKYRPISLLSVFSKLYEKCKYSRLYSFFFKFKILFNRQFGFRNNYSTNHALINLVDLIKKYLYNDYYVCGVFIDLQKALETVNHDILLEKFDYYGIRGLADNWLRSFLKNRKQYVSLQRVSSSIKTVTCGVPQGSTLGPLSFLLYINDLQCAFSISHSFADDTNLIFLSKKLGTIGSVINNRSVINNELKHLVQWLRGNKPSLNKTKTELIIFRSPWKQLPREPDIRLNNCKLKLHTKIIY